MRRVQVDVYKRQPQGDAACRATLARHSTRLARALAAVINLLDPDVIVLGGGLSRLSHLYTQVPALWGRWVFSGGVRDPVRTRLLPSEMCIRDRSPAAPISPTSAAALDVSQSMH